MAWQEEKNETAVFVQLFKICIFQVSHSFHCFFFPLNKHPTKYVCTQEVLFSEADKVCNKVIDIKHTFYLYNKLLLCPFHQKEKKKKLSLKFSHIDILPVFSFLIMNLWDVRDVQMSRERHTQREKIILVAFVVRSETIFYKFMNLKNERRL